MSIENEFETADLHDSVPEALQSRKALIDPFDWYHEKRQNGPIQYDEQREVYDVFSYDTVKRILQNGEQFLRPSLTNANGASRSNDPLMYLDNAMMWSDGTEHKQVKSDLFEYFSPNQMMEMRNVIEEVSESVLRAAVETDTEFDFAQEFAEPISLRITMKLLGVPQGDYTRIYDWITEITNIKRSEYRKSSGNEPVHSVDAIAYMRELIETRKRNPTDDLISTMATETSLESEQVGANALDLMVASTKTMSEFLTNAVYLLVTHELAHNDVFDRFPDILEEVLRYRSPIQAQLRVAGEDVTVAGEELTEGDEVVVWFGAANRDPDQYDRPDDFIPDRNPEHLAFGTGAHACIGAPLARFEAPIILEYFIENSEQITISNDSIVPTLSPSSLGFNELPVSVEEES